MVNIELLSTSFIRDLIARFQREETYLFVLRVMVALVILYDHVHPVGAFRKSSNMDVGTAFSAFSLSFFNYSYLYDLLTILFLLENSMQSITLKKY